MLNNKIKLNFEIINNEEIVLGIIAKEGSRNAIIMYAGAALGAINTILLYPKMMPKAEYGVITILTSIAFLVAGLSAFGANTSIIKYLPYYRQERSKSNQGLLTFLLFISLVFSLLTTCILVFFKDYVLEPFEGGAKLFVSYYYYVIPLFLAILLMELFANYANSLLKTTLQVFLKEVFLRLGQTVLILLSYFKIIDFNGFVILYVAFFFICFLILYVYLFFIGEISLTFKSRIPISAKWEIIKFGGYSFFSSIAATLAFRIDTLMVSTLLVSSANFNEGLESAAVYVVALNIAAVIDLPFRAIGQIVNPLISKYWSLNDVGAILDVYKKTTETMIITGAFVFIGIWACISDVVGILPDDYSEVKYVFLWLGIGKFINVACGSNATIIINSKYYKFFALMTFTTLVLTVVTNFVFIQYMGIVGAALATAITYVLVNFAMFYFLYRKFNLQPFKVSNLITLGVALLVYLIFFKIDLYNPWINIVVKAIGMSLVYWLAIIKLGLSSDINTFLSKVSLINRVVKIPKVD